MNNLAGTVLLQRFRLDALERQDYLGDNYRGWDLKRSLPLTIKLLRAQLPHDPTLLTFQQGSSTLQTLIHPHIVPFYGLYQDQNWTFFVERYVEGHSLRDHLLELHGLPMRTGDALIYLKALCLALTYAHGFGLVHCSVNPSNIWYERGGNILLGGFGLARSLDSRMTLTGLAGPPVYVAPEMLRRQEVSGATDIYALGLVLFELLTGQHPFLGPVGASVPPGLAEKLGEAHLNQAPPNPRTLNPAIPDGLAQVTLTALAKSPRERYQSPQEMLEIACALMGSSPEAISDRFAPPAPAASDGEATLVMPAPVRPQTYAAPAPGRPAVGPAGTQVMPVSGQAAVGSGGTQVVPQPGGYPSTQVVPPVSGGYFPPAPPPAAPMQAEAPAGRNRWLIPAILLGLAACLMVGAAAAFLLSSGWFTAAPAPSPSPALIATNTLPPTTTAPPAAPTAAPAQGELPTETPLPSPTPAPTDTPPPTPTPPPTATLIPTSRPTAFKVTIQNNLGFPVYAFRDGSLMGTDPIPPRMYIFYRGIPAGAHTFTVCQTPNGGACRPARQVDVQQDLTITFP